ncbi:hypothetical protein ABZZ49_18390 [Streptomyces zaomyceticus]
MVVPMVVVEELDRLKVRQSAGPLARGLQPRSTRPAS